MANTTADIYNQNVTFTNTGSSYIDVGYGAGTTQLNGDVYVNSTSGTGVRFGQGSGLVNLASGKTVNVGGTGFSAGALYFRNFTQTGSTAPPLLPKATPPEDAEVTTILSLMVAVAVA